MAVTTGGKQVKQAIKNLAAKVTAPKTNPLFNANMGTWTVPSWAEAQRIKREAAEAKEAKAKLPTTRKLGGKEGRPKQVQFGEQYIQCPCMLKTEADRLYCEDWRSNRMSTDCLYLVGDVWEKEEQLHCWLGLRK